MIFDTCPGTQLCRKPRAPLRWAGRGVREVDGRSTRPSPL
ncbi:hypothetical protein SHJG_5298 [Streptomyces hygroscopicus subsp. jinggangensis 5008]|nr:hypothetical protein SHJG_5298 [Streptomyces hygroscopicus subsp. jinggangensis 5008]AGF64725.1 hypothetical protein SHJGH_5062 [Streptomyces hygroscopicus subsp. jinggangensis TL01]